MPRLFILFVFCLVHFLLNAQTESCQERLIEAQDAYDRGAFNEAIELAKPCGNSASINEAWQSHRLLAISFLAQNDFLNAKMEAEKMLNLNPMYRSNPIIDPGDFSKLLNTITVIPKFSIGLAVSAGPVYSLLEVPTSFVIGEYEKSYTAKSGFQTGVQLGFYLSPSMALNSGFSVCNRRYEIDYQPDNWKMNIASQLTYLSIPIQVQYILNPSSRLRYFIQGGPSFSYLLYANSDFTANLESVERSEKFELLNANVKDMKDNFNVGLGIGTGFFYKLDDGHINLQVDYIHSLNLVNNPSTRFSNTQQMFTFQYVDDDVKVHSLGFSLGYSLYLNYKVYNKSKRIE